MTVISQLLEEAKDLVVGNDAGNISTKTTYVDNEGELTSFTMPTVIAPAPLTAVHYGGDMEVKDVELEDYLHVRISSKSLDTSENNKTWFVGELAKDDLNRIQPTVEVEDGSAEDKFSDDNRNLFIIPVLTGMAVAALKNGLNNVKVPLSIGLPSETYLKQEQALKMRFAGSHSITFVDGAHANETVHIHIDENLAQIHAESVTTVLALKLAIKKNKLVKDKFFDDIKGKSYILTDLGAGTNDSSAFEANGINKGVTRQFAAKQAKGTNPYIDAILEEIIEMDAFEKQREMMGDSAVGSTPPELSSRETFMKNIVKPVIAAIVNEDEETPKTKEVIEKLIADAKFKVSWGAKRNVDITEIVLKQMTAYAQDQIKTLHSLWNIFDAEASIVVGGGVLFGYLGGLHALEEEGFKVPNIANAQYFTSKSYAIASFMMNEHSKNNVKA